jgi:ribose-phosphate pyrophosphokinase
MRLDDSKFTTIPVGKLGIIAMESCSELGKKVDEYLVKWHKERQASDHSLINETAQDTFLLDASCP